MSFDDSAFPHHSVLSPPLVAAIDSQHTFSPFDGAAPSSCRPARVDVSAVSQDQSTSTSPPPRTRSRASSAASLHGAGIALSSQQQQNGHTASHRKVRRSAQHAHSAAHSRSGSRSGPMPMPARPTHFNVYSSSAPSDEHSHLNGNFRNRSTTHLDGLRSLSTANEQQHRASGAVSAVTAPPSPLMSASATSILAMSPVAQASAVVDHLMPSEWNLDGSVPTTPYTNLSRNASDYFDPTLLAQLQSQNGSSHPELRANGRHGTSPPIDTALGHLSPHQTQAIPVSESVRVGSACSPHAADSPLAWLATPLCQS